MGCDQYGLDTPEKFVYPYGVTSVSAPKYGKGEPKLTEDEQVALGLIEKRVPVFGGTLPASVITKLVNRDTLLERLVPLIEDRIVLKKHGMDTANLDDEIDSILYLLGG